MKVTLESTTKIVEVNGVPARCWEGKTDSGIPVIALITRIAVPNGHPTEQFERELLEQRPPTAELSRAFDARLVI
jgi:hypothetical protein